MTYTHTHTHYTNYTMYVFFWDRGEGEEEDGYHGLKSHIEKLKSMIATNQIPMIGGMIGGEYYHHQQHDNDRGEPGNERINDKENDELNEIEKEYENIGINVIDVSYLEMLELNELQKRIETRNELIVNEMGLKFDKNRKKIYITETFVTQTQKAELFLKLCEFANAFVVEFVVFCFFFFGGVWV